MLKKYGPELLAIGILFGCLVLLLLCWQPKLEVIGVFMNAKGNMAVVNDELVHEGENVKGAEVVRITEEGVVFRFKNKEFLRKLSRQVHKRTKTLPPMKAYPSPATVETPSEDIYSSEDGSETSQNPAQINPANESLEQSFVEGNPAAKYLLRLMQLFNPGIAQKMMQDTLQIKQEVENRKQQTLQEMRKLEGMDSMEEDEEYNEDDDSE